MSIVELMRRMRELGAPPEAIELAVEAIETEQRKDADRKAKRAAQKAKERASKGEQTSDSRATVARHGRDSRSDTLLPPPDGPLSFPQTPNLSPLNPPSINPNNPVLPGEPGLPAPKSMKTGRIQAKPDYPGEFEMLWAEFPRSPNSSKLDAFRSWSRLSGDDREHCFEGAIAYAGWLGSQQRPPPPLHLATFVNQRRFDGFTEQQAAQ